MDAVHRATLHCTDGSSRLWHARRNQSSYHTAYTSLQHTTEGRLMSSKKWLAAMRARIACHASVVAHVNHYQRRRVSCELSVSSPGSSNLLDCTRRQPTLAHPFVVGAHDTREVLLLDDTICCPARRWFHATLQTPMHVAPVDGSWCVGKGLNATLCVNELTHATYHRGAGEDEAIAVICIWS